MKRGAIDPRWAITPEHPLLFALRTRKRLTAEQIDELDLEQCKTAIRILTQWYRLSKEQTDAGDVELLRGVIRKMLRVRKKRRRPAP